MRLIPSGIRSDTFVPHSEALKRAQAETERKRTTKPGPNSKHWFTTLMALIAAHLNAEVIPKKTGETVDRCQNNGSVKAVTSTA